MLEFVAAPSGVDRRQRRGLLAPIQSSISTDNLHVVSLPTSFSQGLTSAGNAKSSPPIPRLPLTSAARSLNSSTRLSKSATTSTAPHQAHTGIGAGAGKPGGNGQARNQKEAEGLSNGATAAVVAGIILVLAACVYAIWLLIQSRRRERRESTLAIPLSRWSLESGSPMYRPHRHHGQAATAVSDTWLPGRSARDAEALVLSRAPPQSSPGGGRQEMWPTPASQPWSGPLSSHSAWPGHAGVHGRRGHAAADTGRF